MIYECSTRFRNQEDGKDVTDQLNTQCMNKINKATLCNNIPTAEGLRDKSRTVPCVVSFQTACESFGLWFMWQIARTK